MNKTFLFTFIRLLWKVRVRNQRKRARDVSPIPKQNAKKKWPSDTPPQKFWALSKRSKREARRERRTRSVKNESQTKNTYESTGIVCTGATNSLGGAMFVVVVICNNFPQKRLETEVKFSFFANPSFFFFPQFPLFSLFRAAWRSKERRLVAIFFWSFFDRSPFVAVALLATWAFLVFSRIIAFFDF